MCRWEMNPTVPMPPGRGEGSPETSEGEEERGAEVTRQRVGGRSGEELLDWGRGGNRVSPKGLEE